jgi:hypothetical protein
MKVTTVNFSPKVLRHLLLILPLALATAAPSAFAYRPLVICGSEDPDGNTEVDNVTIERGGSYRNQLVIRNSNIINDFASKGAIHREEINDKGEFIISGLGSPISVNGSRDHRYFSFFEDEQGFTLMVRPVAQDGFHLGAPIAHFHYGNDCQSQAFQAARSML